MRSRTGHYLDFCAAVRAERGGRCQCCGRTAEQAQQKRLHPHHILPVADSGVADRLATSRANVLLICNWCHKFQHPGYRRYPWDASARARGRALR